MKGSHVKLFVYFIRALCVSDVHVKGTLVICSHVKFFLFLVSFVVTPHTALSLCVQYNISRPYTVELGYNIMKGTEHFVSLQPNRIMLSKHFYYSK